MLKPKHVPARGKKRPRPKVKRADPSPRLPPKLDPLEKTGEPTDLVVVNPSGNARKPRALSTNQLEILEVLRRYPRRNTSKLCAILGHEEAYESTLKDSLLRLEARGYVRQITKRAPSGFVTARQWYRTMKPVIA